MKTILSLVIIASLAGCVVAPYRPVVYEPAPAPVVYYPQSQAEYFWDPVALSFFFVFGGHRHYMERGWDYHRHGVPHGYYRH